MSFTTTIPSYDSAYTAPLTTWARSSSYPPSRKRRVLATRWGVLRSPSREGSSPSASMRSRTMGAMRASAVAPSSSNSGCASAIGQSLTMAPAGRCGSRECPPPLRIAEDRDVDTGKPRGLRPNQKGDDRGDVVWFHLGPQLGIRLLQHRRGDGARTEAHAPHATIAA